MQISSARKRRGGEGGVEHLLRRAGFGASQEEIDAILLSASRALLITCSATTEFPTM